ncbi:zinc ribbon domain-containing protein [Rheinheimera salexigens]|uniref:Zinc ribbon domain-containing protein n=1 Tax=Rheinheimera salexigens TaxID=1628148 RepID=A0A1E7Q5X6_9GAMM|nr:zinc ribbon domain-containing protein [Rheinheimera salexigens]OEY69579.1 hypothetical protein BI198_08415 [Rheinheimera salexigens]
MAIIACPFCGQKISDKSTQCNHCKKDLTAMTTEKMHSLARDKRFDKVQSLITQSMLALVLFLFGFGLLYWWDPQPGSNQQLTAYGCIAIGFCWYIITRGRILMLKKRK